jgi:hypothetical protein
MRRRLFDAGCVDARRRDLSQIRRMFEKISAEYTRVIVDFSNIDDLLESCALRIIQITGGFVQLCFFDFDFVLAVDERLFGSRLGGPGVVKKVA